MNKKETLMKMPVFNHTDGSFITNIETFYVYESIFPYSMVIPLHWHDNYLEIEIVTGGSGTEIFNGNEFTLQKGDITLLSYTDFHSVIIEKGLSLFKLNVSYNLIPQEIKTYLSENNNIRCNFKDTEYEYIYSLFLRLQNYCNENDNQLNLMAGKAIISTILAETIRHSETLTDTQKKSKQIQNIIQYINKNLDSDLSLENLAFQFGTSANYLGKLFKKNIGVPYNEYINRIRLKYACTLIASSNISMKEIAHSCGFSSLEYFYYVFKKYNNMTPSQYREKAKSTN